MPVTVADLRGPASRVDDVGEEHRGEHPIVGHLCLVPGEEFGDLLEGISPARFDEVPHVATRQLDVLRARYVVSDVSAPRGQDDCVLGVMDDEGLARGLSGGWPARPIRARAAS